MPEVTAVVANYQGETVLGDCLASLTNQTLVPAEILVVDAGSTDGGTALAESLGAKVIATDNRGVGRLYNIGARAATTPLVLLANNDVAFAPNCVRLLASALEREENCFAADPTQLDWDSGAVIHSRTEIERGRLIREPLPGFRVDQTRPAGGVEPTLFANGAAMLVRRDLLLELGGFDESFFMEFEEIDVCWRAWLRGWKTIHVPAASLRHHVATATSLEGVQRRRVASAHYNLIRFALKCLPLRGVARVLAGELLRLPVHPRLVAPALASAAADLPKILRARAHARPSLEVYEWLLSGQPGSAPSASAR